MMRYGQVSHMIWMRIFLFVVIAVMIWWAFHNGLGWFQ
jgi:hypothetical protein